MAISGLHIGMVAMLAPGRVDVLFAGVARNRWASPPWHGQVLAGMCGCGDLFGTRRAVRSHAAYSGHAVYLFRPAMVAAYARHRQIAEPGA